MRMFQGIATILLLLSAPALAGGGWQVTQTPVSENLNGISLVDRHFGIGVGNNGSIVHFVDDDAGTLMPSGTNFPLLDVYALDTQTAVAAGKDIVLLWDGSSWQPIRENQPPQDQFFSPVWMTPEKDLVLYGTLGQTTNFVCPYEPGAAQQGFCRGFGPSTLTMCGKSDDIKIVLTTGSIWWLDNTLNNPDDPFDTDPMFDPPTPLDLKAAWIAPTACIGGPIPPQDIFAIDVGNRFWRFDGSAWTQLPDTIDADHTLNWLGGTGGGNVLAVGSRPSMTPGTTEGIAWRFDGGSWSEELLPAGTPGLADVALALSLEVEVFSDGFEQAATPRKASEAAIRSWVTAIADGGKVAINNNAPRGTVADLSVTMVLLTPPPYSAQQAVEVIVVVTNNGPDTATVPLLGFFSEGMLSLNDTCMGFSAADDYLNVALDPLPAGGSTQCRFFFELESQDIKGQVNIRDLASSDPVSTNSLDFLTFGLSTSR